MREIFLINKSSVNRSGVYRARPKVPYCNMESINYFPFNSRSGFSVDILWRIQRFLDADMLKPGRINQFDLI